MKFVVAGIGTWGREWAELVAGHPETAIVATVDVALEAVAADALVIVTNPGQHNSSRFRRDQIRGGKAGDHSRERGTPNLKGELRISEYNPFPGRCFERCVDPCSTND